MAKIFGKLLAPEKGSVWLKEIQTGICISLFSSYCDKMPDKSKAFFGITIEGHIHRGEEGVAAATSAVRNQRERTTLTHPTFSVFIQS